MRFDILMGEDGVLLRVSRVRTVVCKRRSKSAPGVGPKVRHPGSGISRLSAGVKSLLQSVV